MKVIDSIGGHAAGAPEVCEMQGIYGPLQIMEIRIQQIWALQEIQAGDWRSRSGARLRVIEPGLLNRGAGPDFREAIIEVDGERRIGDVELHLYREDWWHHGHDQDPAYNEVLLHVVLFPGGMERPVLTAAGGSPQEWVMVPWLREDLESISGGDPGIFGERVPELADWLAGQAPWQARQVLRYGAQRRLENKVAMARSLLLKYGWSGTCHTLMLYHLGFPFHRREFVAIADAYPAEVWSGDPEVVAAVRRSFANVIHWQWGRPANRPETRLRQYQQLWQAVPHWPQALLQLGTLASAPVPAPAGGEAAFSPAPPDAAAASAAPRMVMELSAAAATGPLRKSSPFADYTRAFADLLAPANLPANLTDRLWVDAVLPALAAAHVLPFDAILALWFHARPASFPTTYRQLFRSLHFAGMAGFVLANGWNQGFYWQEDQLRIERLRRV